MLQSKNPPADIKDGNLLNCFSMNTGWMDEAYKANLKREYLPDDFKLEKYLIYYGQDFSKYYLGYLHVDFDNRTYSIPEDQADKTAILKTLADLFFGNNKESRLVIMTATRPSDNNIIPI